MKLNKDTLTMIAALYGLGALVTLLYVQPWSASWAANEGQSSQKVRAWEYVALWPWSLYKLAAK